MKDKIMSIFLAFVRKVFTKERILELIGGLLDIFYARFAVPDGLVEENMIDLVDAFYDLKEACEEDEVNYPI